ncbi:MAG: response regulator, partial [Betaproteobacteria bacterium]
AFKFTLKGAVSLKVSSAQRGWTPGHPTLDAAQGVLAISVIDTGIGVAADKQRIIFEAFRQADGTTSRQFEGTGLGLSISSELARLLGGEIRLESELGVGSTFTLFLPVAYRIQVRSVEVAEEKLPNVEAVRTPDRAESPAIHSARVATDEDPDQLDDRDKIRAGDRVVLIVMDNESIASKLLHQVRELGFKAVRAANAHTALALANEYMPNVVNVEISQRNMSGWAIRNLLKHDPDTRHIPVNMICVDNRQQTFSCICALGIVATTSRRETLRQALHQVEGFLHRQAANVLVAAGGKVQRKQIIDAIASTGLHATGVGTGSQALKMLRKADIDCTIIGQNLSDMTDFMREVAQSESIKQTFLVLHSSTEQDRFAGDSSEIAEVLWLKRVQSAEAVVQETARCLQLTIQEMPRGHRRPLPSMRQSIPALSGRKVLIVDDDIRNIFALAGALEQQGLSVLNAESGREAVEMLNANSGVDIVLMDIMMPEQDGYQTISAIRAMASFSSVPIIGVTAKAMKGDREKCIEAGATDYISKPINMDMLLSLMRMWIADKDPAAAR